MGKNHKEHKLGLISLGFITKLRGNKGEVTIGLSSREKDNYRSIKKVVIRPREGEEYELKVEKLWFHRNRLIAKFFNYNSYAQVEHLVGCEVLISEKELMPPERGDYYVFQLLGLKVYALGGTFLGYIKDIMFTGGTDIIVVLKDGKEYLIPMADEYLENLDLNKNEIVIKLPEGLLEINEV